MSNQIDVPDDVVDMLSDSGINMEQIKQAWARSGYNKTKIFDLLCQQDQNQNDKKDNQQSINYDHGQIQMKIDDNDFFGESYLDKHVSKKIKDLLVKKLRKSNSFVGIENNENDSVVNIILQLFHKIPQIYEKILKVQCNNTQESGKLLRLIQLLLTELTASNQSLISSQKILTSNFWGTNDIEILERQKEPAQIFFYLLMKLDQCLIEQIKQELVMNEFFKIKEFNSLFQIKFEGSQYGDPVLLYTNMEQDSVLSFLNENYTQKVIALPQILCIQINRKNRNEKAFIVNERLDIEFMKTDYKGKRMSQVFPSVTYSDLEILYKNYNCIQKVIEMYEKEENQQQANEVIKILKSKQNSFTRIYNEKQGRLQQEKSQFDNQSQGSNYKYVIHSIALEKGDQNNKTLILYIQSYKDKKWLRYLNSQCQVVEEEESVLIDSNKYGLFVTYINTNLIPQFMQHLDNQKEICNIISQNHSQDLNKISSLKNLVPKDVLTEVFTNNLKYKQNFKE